MKQKKAKEAKEDRNKIFENIDRLRGKKKYSRKYPDIQ